MTLNNLDLTSLSSNILNHVEAKTKLITSGVMARSPELDALCAGKDILLPFNGETAVKLIRSQQWSANKLDSSTTASEIAERLGDYESRRLSAATFSVLAGAFDGDASSIPCHLTFDASGNDFVPGKTNFTYDNFIAADPEGLKLLVVHTAVFNRMRKNNLMDFRQDSVSGESVPTYEGLDVVYDDSMPRFGNVYHSYLAAPGALQIGWDLANNVSTVETVDTEEGQQEILERKWSYCIHPVGHSYVGTFAGPTAANGELSSASAWSRSADAKTTLVRLITREA